MWTGAKSHREIERINISELLRKKYIAKGGIMSGGIRWENGNSISYEADLQSNYRYLRLSYTLNSESGSIEQDYKIKILSTPSNLGKGELLYFECPQSGNRCRILYRVYGSMIWKSRLAYSKRIYYTAQLTSKRFKDSTRYYLLEEKLARLRNKAYLKWTYNGKPTKTAQRIYAMENKLISMGNDPSIMILEI